MPTTTRTAKKAAAPRKRAATPKETPVTEPVNTETPENPDTTSARKRPGRKVSPFLAASRAYDKATHRLDRARARAAKVQDVADELAAAEAEEAAAAAELAKYLPALPADGNGVQ